MTSRFQLMFLLATIMIVGAAKAQTLTTGCWSFNANGYPGSLCVGTITASGMITGTVYGQSMHGFWNETTKKITFMRTPNVPPAAAGGDASRFQIYEGYWFPAIATSTATVSTKFLTGRSLLLPVPAAQRSDQNTGGTQHGTTNDVGYMTVRPGRECFRAPLSCFSGRCRKMPACIDKSRNAYGTGKTETMLAVLVKERLSKLLVIVPTDDLRDQLGRKFLTFGVLRGERQDSGHGRGPSGRSLP